MRKAALKCTYEDSALALPIQVPCLCYLGEPYSHLCRVSKNECIELQMLNVLMYQKEALTLNIVTYELSGGKKYTFQVTNGIIHRDNAIAFSAIVWIGMLR